MEREIETAEILRRTRIEAISYIRELRGHTRAIRPRIQISRTWIEYYEDLSKIRPLTRPERRRLERHRNLAAMYEARIELFRQMGRYARTRRPEEYTRMRMARADYYEAKMVLLPPEEAEELRKEVLPPPEAYERWREKAEELRGTEEAIESVCKAYKEAKRTRAWERLPSMERYLRTRTMQRLFADRYELATEMEEIEAELGETGREYVEAVRETVR